MSQIERPYFFRYVEDPSDEISRLLDKELPSRPAVAVRLGHLDEATMRVTALVDSGSERIVAGPGLARSLRLDLRGAPEGLIGLGGGQRRVHFQSVRIELFENLLVNDDAPIDEWDADVAFLAEWEPPWAVLLGRDGFFNRFTVTLHGGVPGMVLERWDAFDQRFGVVIEEADISQPRFRP